MSPLRLMPLLLHWLPVGRAMPWTVPSRRFTSPGSVVMSRRVRPAVRRREPLVVPTMLPRMVKGSSMVIDSEAFFFGEATVTPGSSFEGIGEFWAMRWDDEEEVILCEASWNVVLVQSVPACEGCTFAFRVRYSNV